MKAAISGFSVRELQVYGAACLACFCSAKRINSSMIEELIEHLLLLMTSTNLPEWERAGGLVQLPGRGDSMPADLEQSIDPNLALDFSRLVEAVVEIGIVDMYGEETGLPLHFLQLSCDLLEKAGVELPPFEEVCLGFGQQHNRGWGAPASEDQFEKARNWCLQKLRKT